MLGKKKSGTEPLAVIAMGTSAEGLTYLPEFFAHLPEQAAYCIVFVHNSPDDSLSDSLGSISKFKVCEATQGSELRSQHMYVVPPGQELFIQNNRIELRTSRNPSETQLSIDQLFKSFAVNASHPVIAVELSDKGTDAFAGLQALAHSRANYLLILQEPNQAAYHVIPNASLGMGMTALTLSPKRMGEAIHLFIEGKGSKLRNFFQPAESPPFSHDNGRTRLEEPLPMGALTQIAQPELPATSAELEAYLAEIKANNEALIALNKELSSANEALHGANQELATQKEELEAALEELEKTHGELCLKAEQQRTKEANTQALLNNNLQALMLVDSQYRLLSFNRKAEQVGRLLCGKHVETGSLLTDCIPSADLPHWQRSFSQALEGQIATMEQRVEDKKGLLRWFRIHFNPAKVEQGTIQAVSMAMLEITDLKLSLSKLNASEQIVKSVFEATGTGICITDKDGTFVEVNQAYCTIYGYDRSQLIGQHFTVVVAPENRQLLRRMHDEFINGGEELPGEFEVINAEGKALTVAVSSTLVVQESGARFKITSIRDISEESFNQNQVKQLSQNLPVVMFQYFVKADGEDGLQNISGGSGNVWGIPAHECNERVAELWGGVHPDDIGGFTKKIQVSGETMEAWTDDYRYYHPTKGLVWLSGLGIPRKTSEGTIIWDSMVFDVTQEKETELAKNRLQANQDALINNTQDLIWSIDMDRRLIVANDSCRNYIKFLTGTELKEGDSMFLDVYDPELANRWKRYYDRGLKGEAFSDTEHYLEPSGKTSSYLISFNPIRNEQGQITGLACYSKDISAYIEQQKLLEQATQIAQLGYYRHILKDGYVYWSHEMKMIFELSGDASIPTEEEYIQLIHSDDRAQVQQAYQQAYAESGSIDLVYRLMLPQGNMKWIREKGSIKVNLLGASSMLEATIQDITVHKEYERSLQKINQELDQRARELALSNAELEQFAYVASHDLQEPLRMITSFLARLEEKYADKLDEKALRYIEFAVDGGKRMRQIILDLLEFSRVAKQGDKLTEIDVKEVVEEACAIHQRTIEQLGVQLEIQAMPVLKAYRTHLLHIFQNLISNAIKYHHPDRIAQVCISAKEEEGQYIFAIQDNGIGIKAEYFDKIFTIFQRLHSQKEYEGTGMGLAIVKKSVASMGGEVWVESEYGEGSTFFFSILKVS